MAEKSQGDAMKLFRSHTKMYPINYHSLGVSKYRKQYDSSASWVLRNCPLLTRHISHSLTCHLEENGDVTLRYAC